ARSEAQAERRFSRAGLGVARAGRRAYSSWLFAGHAELVVHLKTITPEGTQYTAVSLVVRARREGFLIPGPPSVTIEAPALPDNAPFVEELRKALEAEHIDATFTEPRGP